MSSNYAMPAGGDISNDYVRKVGDEIVEVEQTKDEWMACVVPPPGQYRLRITGFAVPFQTPNKYKGQVDKNGRMDERDFLMKTKLDLVIVGGPGDGKHVLIWAPWPSRMTPGTNIGRVFFAATGYDPDGTQDMYDPVDMLGCEFLAFVQGSEGLNEQGKPKTAVMLWESVKPVSAEAVADAAAWS